MVKSTFNIDKYCQCTYEKQINKINDGISEPTHVLMNEIQNAEILRGGCSASDCVYGIIGTNYLDEVYYTQDSGSTWYTSTINDKNLLTVGVRSAYMTKNGKYCIFANGVQDVGGCAAWYSNNYGETFNYINNIPLTRNFNRSYINEAGNIAIITANQINNIAIVIGFINNNYTSTTWTTVAIDDIGDVYYIAFNSSLTNIWVPSAKGLYFFESNNSSLNEDLIISTNWNKKSVDVNTSNGVVNLSLLNLLNASSSLDGKTVIIGGFMMATGIFLSTDYGATFTMINENTIITNTFSISYPDIHYIPVSLYNIDTLPYNSDATYTYLTGEIVLIYNYYITGDLIYSYDNGKTFYYVPSTDVLLTGPLCVSGNGEYILVSVYQNASQPLYVLTQNKDGIEYNYYDINLPIDNLGCGNKFFIFNTYKKWVNSTAGSYVSDFDFKLQVTYVKKPIIISSNQNTSYNSVQQSCKMRYSASIQRQMPINENGNVTGGSMSDSVVYLNSQSCRKFFNNFKGMPNPPKLYGKNVFDSITRVSFNIVVDSSIVSQNIDVYYYQEKINNYLIINGKNGDFIATFINFLPKRSTYTLYATCTNSVGRKSMPSNSFKFTIVD